MSREAVLERLNIRLDEVPAKLVFKKGTNGHSRILRFLVTGGCGYFGYELATAIHELGGHVTLFDLQIPSKIEKSLTKSLVFVKGDVCDYEALLEACKRVDCVFHVASFGMTGKDQLDRWKTYDVNVVGTENVIKACQESTVSKLIYTSSYNVVFGLSPIINGDETVPYAAPSEMFDYYSRSKQEADKLILAANGTEIAGGRLLRTCCLRSAGIYGPQERKHIHRVAGFIRKGIVIFQVGNARLDWTHVNNLTQAHLLALPALSEATGRIAAGKAYFISDGNPIKTYDFLKPLFYGLGKTVPRYSLPMTVIYYIGFLMELIFWLLRPVILCEPLLTRTEVLKMNVSHYQNQRLAMKELGYRPFQYEFSDVVKLYIKETYPDLSQKYAVDKEPKKVASHSAFGRFALYILLLCLLHVLVTM